MAAEKVRLLEAYGAEVIVCPTAVAPEDPDSYYSTAERLTRETPGAFRPGPVLESRQSLRALHDDRSGDLARHRRHGDALRRRRGHRRHDLRRREVPQGTEPRRSAIIAADPEGSVYSGGEGRPYLTEGVGEDFWPANYDPSLVDEVIAVSDADAFEMARRVTHEEGMLIGGSGGTAVAAALRVAESAPEGSCVVVLVPDTGRGYISKIFNDDWMRGYGFLTTASGPTAGDILDVKGANATDLILATTESERARGDRPHARARRLPGRHRRHRRVAARRQRSRRHRDRTGPDGTRVQGSLDARSTDRSRHGTDPRDDRRRRAPGVGDPTTRDDAGAVGARRRATPRRRSPPRTCCGFSRTPQPDT